MFFFTRKSLPRFRKWVHNWDSSNSKYYVQWFFQSYPAILFSHSPKWGLDSLSLLYNLLSVVAFQHLYYISIYTIRTSINDFQTGILSLFVNIIWRIKFFWIFHRNYIFVYNLLLNFIPRSLCVMPHLVFWSTLSDIHIIQHGFNRIWVRTLRGPDHSY
jgi:hypothetical protein